MFATFLLIKLTNTLKFYILTLFYISFIFYIKDFEYRVNVEF